MSDSAIRKALIRLAHTNPEFRKDILPLVTAATGFPPDEIGEVKPGGSAGGVKGKADGGGSTISDADKPWMRGEFTQQEFDELAGKQDKGLLSDGKSDETPAKVASEERRIRAGLIRIAHENPEFRKDILPLLTGGK